MYVGLTQALIYIEQFTGLALTPRGAAVGNVFRGSKCPVPYRRFSWEEIRSNKSQPYVLFGPRQPKCDNCGKPGWGSMCVTPSCPWPEPQRFKEHLIRRAEAGAPDYKETLLMTPCDWWPFLRGRTLWLVGDSITQEVMRAMMCLFLDFWDTQMRHLREDVPGLSEDEEAKEHVRMGWCIYLPEGSRICHHRVNTLGRPDEPMEFTAGLPFLERMTYKRDDIVILNSGIWCNDPLDFREQLHLFAEAYKQRKQQLPYFLWRDASVQHFHTPTGDFNHSTHNECQDIGAEDSQSKGAITLDFSNQLHTSKPEQLGVILRGGWRNIEARPVMHRLGIPVIETWNKSVPMWQSHHHAHDDPNAHDCTHWCHPSPYQLAVYDMLRGLRAAEPQIAEHMLRLKSVPAPSPDRNSVRPAL